MPHNARAHTSIQQRKRISPQRRASWAPTIWSPYLVLTEQDSKDSIHEAEICEYPIRLFRFYNNLICVYTMMLHKDASTQHHNQQVLVKLHHSPSDREARQKLQQKAKIRSRAYIQLREETLKTVHRTFQPGVPIH